MMYTSEDKILRRSKRPSTEKIQKISKCYDRSALVSWHTSVLAISWPSAGVHQLALQVVPTSPSFWHHLFYEDMWINFAVTFSGVTTCKQAYLWHSYLVTWSHMVMHVHTVFRTLKPCSPWFHTYHALTCRHTQTQMCCDWNIFHFSFLCFPQCSGFIV